MATAEIKDYNVLIDSKNFFDIPIKNKEAYEKIMEMNKTNDYTTNDLLFKALQISCNTFK